jgi:hypothetical protein
MLTFSEPFDTRKGRKSFPGVYGRWAEEHHWIF